MPTQPNLETRTFRWSDLDQFRRLLIDAGSHGHRDWPVDSDELRAELEFPRVQPEINIALAINGTGPIGYAIVEPEANIGRSVIGIGSSRGGLATRNHLLEWAMNRAKQVAPIAHLSTRDSEVDLERLVEQFGWTKVRDYLKLQTRSQLQRAQAHIPDGFSVRTMLGLDEVPELTYLQNEAFSEHFGYSPNTEDEIKARLLASESSLDDIVMIHDSDELLVAYCWTKTFSRDGAKIGRIGMTGVLPKARGLGLGRAIAEVGYNHLLDHGVESIELDVDSVNAAAVRIYSSLGFEESSQVHWWERTL